MIRTFEKKQDLFEEIVAYFYANTDVISVLNQKGAPSIVFYSDDTRKEGADARLEELLDATKLERVGRWRTIFPGAFTSGTPRAKILASPLRIKDLSTFQKLLNRTTWSSRSTTYQSCLCLLMYRHLQGNWYLYIQHID